MYSEVGGALSWFGRPSCRRRLPSDESEILRYISKLRLAALVWFFLFFPATVQADCNPTFGQQVYDWVNNKAFGLSRQLADFDYAARILNYHMVSLDELHSTIHSASDNLDEIAVHIRTSEVISSVLACEASRQHQEMVRAGPGKAPGARDVAGELWSYFEDFLGRLDRHRTPTS
jgi:hypothetical protein